MVSHNNSLKCKVVERKAIKLCKESPNIFKKSYLLNRKTDRIFKMKLTHKNIPFFC